MRHIAARNGSATNNNTAGQPLSEAVLLILLSMAEGPRHGYAILKDVEELSHGRVRLSTGTLYGALRRMLDNHWIEPFEEDDAPRDRTAYRLTPIGHDVLLAEVTRMKVLTRVASLRMRHSGLSEAHS